MDLPRTRTHSHFDTNSRSLAQRKADSANALIAKPEPQERICQAAYHRRISMRRAIARSSNSLYTNKVGKRAEESMDRRIVVDSHGRAVEQAVPEVEEQTILRATVGASIGNLVEWFDFAVYGYLATTLAVVFFPS